MEKAKTHRKIIISGGGTGGHVFPAIAIADALCRQLDAPEILFVGAEGRLEMEKVPEAGYEIIGLPVEGFRRKLSFSNLKVVMKLLSSLRMAARIIRKFSPDVVVGVGGYASGPTLRKAAGMGIPTLIQEQNSYAGVTNRLLAKKAERICVAYDGMEKYFPANKLVKAGNPVRKEILEMAGKGNSGNENIQKARSAFGIEPGSSVLLILGGSLGARTINQAVISGLEQIIDSGIYVIWQCGKYYYEEAKRSLENLSKGKLLDKPQDKSQDKPQDKPQDKSQDKPQGRIILKDFIGQMDQAYQSADIIIARAGAITISELCLVGKPALLVPSPNVAEDHQTKNALALADKTAAILIPDREAGERLIPEALDLLKDKEQMDKLSENISRLAIVDSSERIAREVIEVMNV